jgi:hypothetical protein
LEEEVKQVDAIALELTEQGIFTISIDDAIPYLRNFLVVHQYRPVAVQLLMNQQP